MQPWDAYLLYNALKLHFESDGYDAFKYNFKTSAKAKSFLQRKDRFFFAKLAKKYPDKQTLIDFLVANFTARGVTKLWAGDLLDQDADDHYLAWLKIRDTMSYFFAEQVDKLALYCERKNLQFDDLFTKSEGSYPLIVSLYLDHSIELETLVIFDILVGYMQRISVTETIVWPQLERMIYKYRRHLSQNIDPKKLREVILKRFTS
jgi:hypothetical protein